MNETDLPDHVLLTKGIKSPVMDGPAGRLSGIGHMALLDWDDHVSVPQAEALHEAHSVRGPTLIFESSPGNLHGWNLTVRPFEKTAVFMDDMNDDGKHRSVGVNRGWWRLRAGPKVPADSSDPAEAYKPVPKLVDVIDPDDGAVISAPHLVVARAMAGENILPDADRRYDLRGTTVLVATYTTFTDLEKPIQRGAE